MHCVKYWPSNDWQTSRSVWSVSVCENWFVDYSRINCTPGKAWKVKAALVRNGEVIKKQPEEFKHTLWGQANVTKQTARDLKATECRRSVWLAVVMKGQGFCTSQGFATFKRLFFWRQLRQHYWVVAMWAAGLNKILESYSPQLPLFTTEGLFAGPCLHNLFFCWDHDNNKKVVLLTSKAKIVWVLDTYWTSLLPYGVIKRSSSPHALWWSPCWLHPSSGTLSPGRPSVPLPFPKGTLVFKYMWSFWFPACYLSCFDSCCWPLFEQRGR